MFNRKKLFLVIINLFFVSCLQSGYFGDFDISSDNMFDYLDEPFLKTVCFAIKHTSHASSKVKSFIVDHPKESAIVVGIATTGILLALNEKNMRSGEGLDTVKSFDRPGLLKTPFQHGFKPYFGGLAIGSVSQVALQRLQLKQAVSKVVTKSQHLNLATTKIIRQAEKSLSQAAQLNQGANNNLTQVKIIFSQSDGIERQAVDTREKLENLATVLPRANGTLNTLDQRVDGLNSSVMDVANSATQAHQKLAKFEVESRAKHDKIFKGQVAFQSVLIAANQKVDKTRNFIDGQISQIQNLSKSQDGRQEQLKSAQDEFEKSRRTISQTSEILDQSLNHLSSLKEKIK